MRMHTCFRYLSLCLLTTRHCRTRVFPLVESSETSKGVVFRGAGTKQCQTLFRLLARSRCYRPHTFSREKERPSCRNTNNERLLAGYPWTLGMGIYLRQVHVYSERVAREVASSSKGGSAKYKNKQRVNTKILMSVQYSRLSLMCWYLFSTAVFAEKRGSNIFSEISGNLRN